MALGREGPAGPDARASAAADFPGHDADHGRDQAVRPGAGLLPPAAPWLWREHIRYHQVPYDARGREQAGPVVPEADRPRRSPDLFRRPYPAQDQPGRAAAIAERAEGRHVDLRAAPALALCPGGRSVLRPCGAGIARYRIKPGITGWAQVCG